MFGILNCNKPVGISSRAVVDAVYRRLKPAKVGHAGTLDPLASGVLLVPVGPAVRLTSYLQGLPKHYDAMFQLGVATASGDLEDAPEAMPDAPVPELSQILAAAEQLTGSIEQVPPAYSAIKIAGQRAYQLVRQGKAVEMIPRTVEIFSIDVLEYAYPNLQVRIVCGSGTYVRSIAVDLAKLCGTVAVMTSLVRTAIGDFSIEQAHSMDQLREGDLATMIQPALSALPNMRTVVLDPPTMQRVEQGQIVALEEPTLSDPQTAPSELAALDADRQLRALLIPRGGGWRAQRCFPR